MAIEKQLVIAEVLNGEGRGQNIGFRAKDTAGNDFVFLIKPDDAVPAILHLLVGFGKKNITRIWPIRSHSGGIMVDGRIVLNLEIDVPHSETSPLHVAMSAAKAAELHRHLGNILEHLETKPN